MFVKRFIQLQFCLDKADKPQVMFYFPEIKKNCENIFHLEVCKCQDITHLKGVLQFSDSEFYCLIKSF